MEAELAEVAEQLAGSAVSVDGTEPDPVYTADTAEWLAQRLGAVVEPLELGGTPQEGGEPAAAAQFRGDAITALGEGAASLRGFESLSEGERNMAALVGMLQQLRGVLYEASSRRAEEATQADAGEQSDPSGLAPTKGAIAPLLHQLQGQLQEAVAAAAAAATGGSEPLLESFRGLISESHSSILGLDSGTEEASTMAGYIAQELAELAVQLPAVLQQAAAAAAGGGSSPSGGGEPVTPPQASVYALSPHPAQVRASRVLHVLQIHRDDFFN